MDILFVSLVLLSIFFGFCVGFVTGRLHDEPPKPVPQRSREESDELYPRVWE